MKYLCVLFFSATILFSITAQDFLLAGTKNGLYKVTAKSVQCIADTKSVRKIINTGVKDTRWFFLTDKGISTSSNLKDFLQCTDGLPYKVIKKIVGTQKQFIRKTQMLKDLEIHPVKKNILVTATAAEVFLSKDSGKTWKGIGCSTLVNGIKAVAVLDLPDSNGMMQLTVLLSHAIYGCSWKQPYVADTWHSLEAGLQSGPEGSEELSDIAISVSDQKTAVYVSQTFTAKLYRLDWQNKQFIPVAPAGKQLAHARCVDGLSVSSDSIIGCKNGGLFEIPLIMQVSRRRSLKTLELNLRRISDEPLSAWIPPAMTHLHKPLVLSELWLLDSGVKPITGKYVQAASDRKGVYLPVHQAKTAQGLQRYFDILAKNKLNTLVIDMKDDFGFVRYDSQDPLIQSIGAVRPYIKLEEFTAKAKARNIYLIARIVSFKDKMLYRYKRNRYAVKNKNGTPWQGFNIVKGVKQPIEEYWVDPYNNEVWLYIVTIAEELIRRGFDEIQFDYIRFPTDGRNLKDACYFSCEQGMDKESALMSFLAYAREKIHAPVSIDIYGANGWYRTGARTGQEVELLAHYVDVICPMFYPSHFRQNFLAQQPAELRPYRIYEQGTYRNKIIARDSVIVRPWVQAFYIPVSYDRKFYNEDYVQRQILGIADGINEGYVYWNNSGRYGDIRPDGSPMP